MAKELTIRAAVELLGCSRSHLLKLLEEFKIPYTKTGKHRRIKFEEIIKYKEQLKEQQKQFINDIMVADEEAGLYEIE